MVNVVVIVSNIMFVSCAGLACERSPESRIIGRGLFCRVRPPCYVEICLCERCICEQDSEFAANKITMNTVFDICIRALV